MSSNESLEEIAKQMFLEQLSMKDQYNPPLTIEQILNRVVLRVQLERKYRDEKKDECQYIGKSPAYKPE